MIAGAAAYDHHPHRAFSSLGIVSVANIGLRIVSDHLGFARPTPEA